MTEVEFGHIALSVFKGEKMKYLAAAWKPNRLNL
jgi:hypothetical protein